MKARMVWLVAAGVMATAVMARAGAKWAAPVNIHKNADGSGEMSGTISSTRNSADTVSRFGCYYERYTPTFGSGQYATCYAYDGFQSLSCGTSDPELTDTIARIAGDTDVWVLVDAGTCMRVSIGMQSFATPKAP